MTTYTVTLAKGGSTKTTTAAELVHAWPPPAAAGCSRSTWTSKAT